MLFRIKRKKRKAKKIIMGKEDFHLGIE